MRGFIKELNKQRRRQWGRILRPKSKFALFQIPTLLIFSNVGVSFFQELNFKGTYISSRKEKENHFVVLTSSIKREIRKFYVAVVQLQQRSL